MRIMCTCGQAATVAVASLVIDETRHCWDGRPCHVEPAENVAPDGGELVGYAARTFRKESPFWDRSEKRLREEILGEQQPEPTRTNEPSAHDLVIADMAARKEFGLAKYGSLLQASNGRDNLQDLYEELLDLAVYLRNEIERRKTTQVAMPFPLGMIDRLLGIAEEGIEVQDGTAASWDPKRESLAQDREFLKELRSSLKKARP